MQLIECTSTEQIYDLIRKNELVILDFWAEWCMPCKAMREQFITQQAQLTAAFPQLILGSVELRADTKIWIAKADQWHFNGIPALFCYYKQHKSKVWLGYCQVPTLLIKIQTFCDHVNQPPIFARIIAKLRK